MVIIRFFVPGKRSSNYLYESENRIFSMKRLYRSKKDRILGGVCAGLGEHLEVDPTVIRLIWAVVTVLSFGTGIIVYVLAWIIIPESGAESELPSSGESVESR
jgi:phage shock protein PspC (stress-responsive transcriptional regulator)